MSADRRKFWRAWCLGVAALYALAIPVWFVLWRISGRDAFLWSMPILAVCASLCLALFEHWPER